MIQNPARYTVTAALIYANGPIHIGHLAGCYLPADIYVRYLRKLGKDVAFISGTDEHGVPITIKAKKEGISPQEVVDKYYKQIKQSFQDFGVAFDIYSRTSNPIHHETSQDFFLNLYNKGIFKEEITEQYFDSEANQFLADRYIIGTCPHCSNANAYGDQCEKCGTSLNPTDLIQPRSTLSGSTPIFKQTKNWYLPLDAMQAQLENYVNSHPEWKSNVFGQCKSWLKQGLQPRAMTRDLDWGVKVPLQEVDGKVLYVWFDAPIGYISMTKELSNNWEKYWKDKESKLVHFIGKDNIVFHCIIFPAMLMTHGDYILADNVPANEFMNLEGEKISTSRNWAVWLHEYLEDFKDQQDVLRYVLTATAPETKDNDFTWKDFQTRNNSELVAILGNFINRTLVLTQKYFDNKVPAQWGLTVEDKACLEAINTQKQAIVEDLNTYKFRDGLTELMNLARIGNKYLADMEPWKVYKEDPIRVQSILNVSLQISAALAQLMEPFMPFTAKKLQSMLNIQSSNWDNVNAEILQAGHHLGEAGLLFQKIEDEAIQHQIQKLEQSKIANQATEKTIKPMKDSIQFDDFAKVDLRLGTILEAERVPKTDKLLKLKVDTGIDQRTIVSGIAHCFNPDDIIGKQVTVLINLEPRKIKGIESQGMLLMAEDAEGKLQFLQTQVPIENGSGIS